MKYKTNRGFTLIELLVVIAIIGVISTIVLANLSSARAKGYDAGVRQDLTNLRTKMELYYSINGKYDCSGDQTITNLITAAGTSASCSSNASGTYWLANAPLEVLNQVPGGTDPIDWWCVDSNGAGKLEDVKKLINATACL